MSDDGDPASFVQIDATHNPLISTWNHFFAVYDGVAQTMQVYSSDETTFNISPTTPLSQIGGAFTGAANRLTMGESDISGADDSQARHDETAVWRRALSASDVEDHWNGGAALDISLWESSGGNLATPWYYR